jgi:hypothetical protein
MERGTRLSLASTGENVANLEWLAVRLPTLQTQTPLSIDAAVRVMMRLRLVLSVALHRGWSAKAATHARSWPAKERNDGLSMLIPVDHLKCPVPSHPVLMFYCFRSC